MHGSQAGRAGQIRKERAGKQTFMKPQSRQAVQGRQAKPGRSGRTGPARRAGQITYALTSASRSDQAARQKSQAGRKTGGK
jgi:hypothetical protein